MKAIFFDLDNTLYDVQKYHTRAFEKISTYLSQKHGISNSDIMQQLVDIWNEKTSMYSHLFDDFLERLNIKNEDVKNLIDIFNSQEIKNSDFYSDAFDVVTKLKNYYKLGIITDGTVSRQNRKISTSKFQQLFDVIIFTKIFEPKPSILSFQKATEQIQVKPSDSVYAGDNPFLDFKGPKTIGMYTIRILRGEFMNISENKFIDKTIKNLNELHKIFHK